MYEGRSAEESGSSAALLTPEELAVRLRVKRSWVYGHADELGAYRLGKYLRFSLSRVLERLEAGAVESQGVKLPTQRPSSNQIKKSTSGDHGTNSEQI
jgi:excisionase family DNA binding protein